VIDSSMNNSNILKIYNVLHSPFPEDPDLQYFEFELKIFNKLEINVNKTENKNEEKDDDEGGDVNDEKENVNINELEREEIIINNLDDEKIEIKDSFEEKEMEKLFENLEKNNQNKNEGKKRREFIEEEDYLDELFQMASQFDITEKNKYNSEYQNMEKTKLKNNEFQINDLNEDTIDFELNDEVNQNNEIMETSKSVEKKRGRNLLESLLKLKK
jgi:hypothetical protein